MIFVVSMCRTRVIFLFKKYFCADACCISCCRGNKDFIELPATELANIDEMRERQERKEGKVASQQVKEILISQELFRCHLRTRKQLRG